MIELASEPGAASRYRQGIAGDTYNTAVYLARAGLPVHYLTRVGDDAWSDSMLATMAQQQIGTGLIQQARGRQPGLYIIRNDSDGERHFSYWRQQSPARQMFDGIPQLGKPALFYFSGITLAICRAHLGNLVATLLGLRQGGCRIVFDPNYRPHLWQDGDEVQAVYREVLGLCDTVLPTLEDDTALWGIGEVAECAAFYRALGASEVVVKAPCLTAHVYRSEGHWQLQAAPVDAVDTTGAGDSFNAGYLAACYQGADPRRAMAAAQTLAAQVVQQPGAIIEASAG